MTTCNRWLPDAQQHDYTTCKHCTTCLGCVPGHDCTQPSLGQHTPPEETEFTIEVTTSSGTAYSWSGYADNISDALYLAINAREGSYEETND